MKKYSKEIIAEGNKAVMGLKDHINRIIAKILEVESDIVTVAREWKKVIKRATITERIDKVKIILEQEIKNATARREELITQESKSKTDIEMIDQTNSVKRDESTKEEQALPKDQLLASERSKEIHSLIEDIKEI